MKYRVIKSGNIYKIQFRSFLIWQTHSCYMGEFEYKTLDEAKERIRAWQESEPDKVVYQT